MTKLYSLMIVGSPMELGSVEVDRPDLASAKIVIRNIEGGVIKKYKISLEKGFNLSSEKFENIQEAKDYIFKCFPEAEEVK